MPEGGGSNIEIAHHLTERKEESGPQMPRAVEIAEAIVLAIVAITTAWSGYQAALWTGHQSKLYGLASKQRVQAARRKTLPSTSACTTPPRYRSGCRLKPAGRRNSPTCMSAASCLSFVRRLTLGRRPIRSTTPTLLLGPSTCPNFAAPTRTKRVS